MKQEDKDLLFKELCTRLPYGVKVYYTEDCDHDWYVMELIDVGDDEIYITSQDPYVNRFVKTEKIKPYLFPMPSMTEEQRKELDELGLGFYVTCQDIDDDGYIWDEKVFSMIPCTETDDWINANHFDYRGLIEKGLAIDCTNLNIY